MSVCVIGNMSILDLEELLSVRGLNRESRRQISVSDGSLGEQGLDIPGKKSRKRQQGDWQED